MLRLLLFATNCLFSLPAASCYCETLSLARRGAELCRARQGEGAGLCVSHHGAAAELLRDLF